MNQIPAIERIIAVGLALVDKALMAFATSVTDNSANCAGYSMVTLNECGITLASSLSTTIASLAALGGSVFAGLGVVGN
jgi:hypothetical protein